MELFIMRHGPAEGAAASGLDPERDLTEAGRERVRQVSRALLGAGEEPEENFTSSLVRARETARIVRELTHVKPPVIHAHALSMTNGVRELVEELFSSDLDRRMLIGHEPELSGIVRDLTGTRVTMQAGTVVAITIVTEGARVRFVLDPKTLALRSD
jgi:phosphohistidine phosphatase